MITSQESQEEYKTKGYDQPTVFFKFTKLSGVTQSVNLGHGFPDWQPPTFFLSSLQKHLETGNYQYTNVRGIPRLSQNIVDTYEKFYQRKINPLTEVLVTNGAVCPLYCVLTAYLNKGDEAVTLEPFYDCYLPPVKFVGANLIGVTLLPPKNKRDRKEYENISNWKKGESDEWSVDFDGLRKAINEKTKVLILNTPNNPTGKILTYDELKEIAKILEKFPKVVVVMDEVYEWNIYGKWEELPRMSTLPGMWDRTITLHSAGKMFSITGVRLGFVIGSSTVIKNIFPIFQYSVFCLFEPYQQALADCLEEAKKPYEGYENYYLWLRNHYEKCRNALIEGLAKSKLTNVDFYLPDGGFFIMGDISKLNPEAKYCLEGEDNIKETYTKDYRYLTSLANEKHVVAIPASALFTPEHRQIGQNYIRFAFCKKKETMEAAFNNIEKNQPK